MRVRERSCSWFASRVCVRVWGPKDWNRERNDEAIEAADGVESEGDERYTEELQNPRTALRDGSRKPLRVWAIGRLPETIVISPGSVERSANACDKYTGNGDRLQLQLRRSYLTEHGPILGVC